MSDINQQATIERMQKIFEKIIEGCRNVKQTPEIHKDAKNLASAVIRDCNDGLGKLIRPESES